MINGFKKVIGKGGFSLVELMVVVAIIGILAALAVPRFATFQAKARQSEAKNNLSSLYTLQQSYYGDNDAYASGINVTNIGFQADGTTRYGYTLTSGSATAFVATAAAKTTDVILSGSTSTDTWTVDQSKNICATTNVITQVANCLK